MSKKDLQQKLRLSLAQKTGPISDLIYSVIVVIVKSYIFDFALSSQLSMALSLLLLTAGLGLRHKVQLHAMTSILEILIKNSQEGEDSYS